MKIKRIIIVVIIMLPLAVSCIQEHNFEFENFSLESEGTTSVFQVIPGKIALKYDFSKYMTDDYFPDRVEFAMCHPNLTGYNDPKEMRGAIDNFVSIVQGGLGVESSRSSSIILYATLPGQEKVITHKPSVEDVEFYAVHGIPNGFLSQFQVRFL